MTLTIRLPTRRLFQLPAGFSGAVGLDQAVLVIEDFDGCSGGELYAVVAEFNMPRDLLRSGHSTVRVKTEVPQDGAVVLSADVPPGALTWTAHARLVTRSCFYYRAVAAERIHDAKGLDASTRLAIT
jgi:hypothetical protein